MATNPVPAFCSLGDLYDILSMPGVILSTDDGPPTNLGGAIEWGCGRVQWNCNRRYSTDQLLLSPVVKIWAATCSCWYLRSRRGNPVAPGVERLYTLAVADMLEIKKGQNEIPDISARKSFVPTISIKRVEQRPFNRAVIEVSRGSQVSVAENITQEKDLWDLLGYNQSAILQYQQ